MPRENLRARARRRALRRVASGDADDARRGMTRDELDDLIDACRKKYAARFGVVRLSSLDLDAPFATPERSARTLRWSAPRITLLQLAATMGRDAIVLQLLRAGGVAGRDADYARRRRRRELRIVIVRRASSIAREARENAPPAAAVAALDVGREGRGSHAAPRAARARRRGGRGLGRGGTMRTLRTRRVIRRVLYTGPHTTALARWTPILKDFARRVSPPRVPRFQYPPSTPFNSN